MSDGGVALAGSAVAATIIDAVWLANVKTETPVSRHAPLVPVAGPNRSGGATFGVAALF